MYSYIYFACFLIAFCELILFILICERPNIYFTMAYICTLLATFGIWACSVSKSVSEAALASRVIYLGISWILFFLFLCIAYVCKIYINKYLSMFFFLCNTVIMITSFSIGSGTCFYKDIQINITNNGTQLIKEYGIFHSAYKVLLIVYFIGMLILTFWGFMRKNIVSYRYSLSLSIIVAVNIVFYFFRKLFFQDFEVVCITYVISIGILCYLQQRIDLFNLEYLTGIDGKYGSKGILLLDNNLHYMGCSDNTRTIIPKVSQLRLEQVLPFDEDEEWRQIYNCVNAVEHTGKHHAHFLSVGEKTFRCEVREYSKNYLWHKNKKIGYFVTFWDDTEQQNYVKQLNEYNQTLLLKEAQLHEQKEIAENANRTKSAFLSNMSHEIRTPMNAIVGMTEILKRKEYDSETTEYLDNIKHSGEALLAIINDILDFSKVESGKMELVLDDYDLRTLVKELDLVFKTRLENKPVRLEYEIDEQLPKVLIGDSKRIRQILINIMNNAIKFTDEGFVKLSILLEHQSEKEVALRFSISDSGQGIREEDLTKLFDAYQQVDMKKNSQKEGTGLGLAICRQLVQLMGGELKVTSTYGEGSTFYFTIAQQISTHTLSKNEEQHKMFTAPSAHVLVVDDNKMNVRVFQGLFKPTAMQIDVAYGGLEAIELIKQNNYDIVFMDHMMPEIDGVEATKMIRSLPTDEIHDCSYYQNMSIVALTANATEDAKELFFANGVNGFLTKPIKVQEGIDLIYQLLPEDKIVEP